MTQHGSELLSAGELFVRLAEQFPDKMRAAHEATVSYSPKSATGVLASLEAIIGHRAADEANTVLMRLAHFDEVTAVGMHGSA